MNKAAGRYPAKPLEPAMPQSRVTVCSTSNALATTGCEMARSAYDIVLPADKVPFTSCTVHGGDATQFAQRVENAVPKAIPELFQSFRKFFGGK
jgi:penicillin-binding protein 1A